MVPGCGRTTRDMDEGREWICGVHWRATPKGLRSRHVRVKRKLMGACRRRVPDPVLLEVLARAADRRWEACKAHWTRPDGVEGILDDLGLR